MKALAICQLSRSANPYCHCSLGRERAATLQAGRNLPLYGLILDPLQRLTLTTSADDVVRSVIIRIDPPVWRRVRSALWTTTSTLTPTAKHARITISRLRRLGKSLSYRRPSLCPVRNDPNSTLCVCRAAIGLCPRCRKHGGDPTRRPFWRHQYAVVRLFDVPHN